MKFIVNVHMITIRQVEVEIDGQDLKEAKSHPYEAVRLIRRLAAQKAQEEFGKVDEINIEEIETV